MGPIRDKARQNLLKLADEQYRQFHSGLVPGEERILGVRLPELRKMAKEISQKHLYEFLKEMDEVDPGQEDVFYEEIMLEGLTIGYGKLSLGERFAYLDKFVPKIRNWAVCDSCCSTYKFMEKYPAESWEYIQKFLDGSKEFEIRFGLICILDYFVCDEYLDRVFEICSNISHEGYYVKMGVAWLVSVCYVKYPERTEAFLMDNHMDDFTQNKSIQKIRESYRVSKEDKERLKRLKRGNA